jgi:hypothetical protein
MVFEYGHEPFVLLDEVDGIERSIRDNIVLFKIIVEGTFVERFVALKNQATDCRFKFSTALI